MACFDATLDRRGGSGGAAGAVGIFPYRCWRDAAVSRGHLLTAILKQCNLGVQFFCFRGPTFLVILAAK